MKLNMANTYSQLYIHIVFTVKGRENLIRPQWQDELHKYICGIINGQKQKVYAIGGIPDHIHILVSMNPDTSIADLVRDIKTNSSKWINERKFLPNKFHWQEGYGAFSYSRSQLNRVITYINNQEQHHRHKSFKEEYLELLDKFQIDYNEEYLFKWIE